MMTCDSEQVVNSVVDREKSLNLCRRFEATHLASLLPGVLVGDFSSVVFVLRGSMCDRWKDLSVRSRAASKLVGVHVAEVKEFFVLLLMHNFNGVVKLMSRRRFLP